MGGAPSSLVPFPKLDGILAPFWVSVLPSMKWGWVQQYIRPPSAQIFQAPEFKCPNWGIEFRHVLKGDMLATDQRLKLGTILAASVDCSAAVLQTV